MRLNFAACTGLLGVTLGVAHCWAAPPDEVARGRYVATASDCEACHTAPGGKPFAGGLPIESPLGTIYATNITPSKADGIGSYTLAEFTRVIREGIRGDGAHLYPAMPYASYAKMTDGDIAAMYAYFMQDVKPIDEKPAKTTSLPFPYSMRFSMLFWNALFLDDKPYQPDPTQSAEWNRGKYLVSGPAHCGECHTPRGFFMQQESGKQLAGAVIGSWYSPNITPDPHAGIGGLSADEFFHYLKEGRVAGKAQAGGEMALAVQLSFSRMTDEDLRAIVTYVRSLPAIGERDAVAKFDQGQGYTEVAAYRGFGGASFDAELPGGAAELYAGNCATCHGISGQGSRDAYFPSLFHNSALATGDGRNLVAAILFGVERDTAGGLAYMPGFGGKAVNLAAFSDRQVADLSNFLLRHYGNPAYTVGPDLVRQVRLGQAPKPPLVTAVSIGEWAAGVLVVASLAWGTWFIAARRRNRRTHSP